LWNIRNVFTVNVIICLLQSFIALAGILRMYFENSNCQIIVGYYWARQEISWSRCSSHSKVYLSLINADKVKSNSI
jgi:hypothetical protein